MARIREARSLVEGLLGQISAEVSALPGPAMRAMAPILHQAEAELSKDLAKWLRTVENGEAKFGAQQLRVALVQVRGAMRQMRGLNPALFDVLMQANGPAGSLALGHLARQAERFSMIFEGSLRPLPIQPAAVLARGDRLLIRRFRASSARYGEWAATEIQRQLAVGVVRGETFDQMIKRIQRLSPTARSVAGMVKGPGQTADDLARVLGERIRNRAELIVRTEVINAYNAHSYDGIAAAADEDEGYRMRWDAAADSRLCLWCRSLDGKVVKVNETFEGGVKHPPLHPRCRCALTPWHVEWGESPALGTPVRHSKGPTEEELAQAAAAEQERQRAAHQAEMEKRLREQEEARQRAAAEARARAEAKARAEAEARAKAEAEARAAAAAAARRPELQTEHLRIGSAFAAARESHLDDMLAKPVDTGRLASALRRLGKVEQQAIAREELNRVVAHSGARIAGGDLYNPEGKILHVVPQESTLGYHSHKGEIAMAKQQDVLDAAHFFERSGRGFDYAGEIKHAGPAEAKQLRNEVDSAATLVHETLHGHSPIGLGLGGSVSYDAGMVVEEIATEAGTRAIMERQFGFAEPFAKGSNVMGSYDNFIVPAVREYAAILTDLGFPTTEAEGYEKLKSASLAMKADHRVLSTRAGEHVTTFARKLGEQYHFTSQQRAAFEKRMGDALRKIR